MYKCVLKNKKMMQLSRRPPNGRRLYNFAEIKTCNRTHTSHTCIIIILVVIIMYFVTHIRT